MDYGTRYAILEREGSGYIYAILDEVTGQTVKNAQGYEARFLTEAEARAAVPAAETDPDLTWD